LTKEIARHASIVDGKDASKVDEALAKAKSLLS